MTEERLLSIFAVDTIGFLPSPAAQLACAIATNGRGENASPPRSFLRWTKIAIPAQHAR